MSKTALITGASSGIGKALAILHAKRGGDLIIIARREDKLKALQEQILKTYKTKVIVLVKDLTKEETVQEIYDYLEKEHITIDYLINNAGFGGHGQFHERAWEDDLAMIQLNIVALTALTRKFLPSLIKRNQARILNVSSTASLMPGPLQAVYFATKAYVTSFSNALTEELKDTGVTVTNLMPGATDTGFAQTSGMDKTALFDKTFTAQEVALAGYEGMVAGKMDIIAGLTFTQKMMLKMIPLMPKKLTLAQIRQMQELQ